MPTAATFDRDRMRDEVNAMQNIVSKASNDYQFLQQELVNLNTRISAVEKHAVNSEFILQGLERALVDYQIYVSLYHYLIYHLQT